VPAPQPASGLPPGASRLRLPALLRALRHRNYRLFFGGQLISLTGTWMQSVAQGWLVLRLTDSPAWLGVVAAAMSVPALLFSLPAGTLADRVPRRSVLVTTQTCAMLLALTMALLTFSGRIQVWHIILLAALLGMVNAFDAPTRQAFTIEMVGREDLLNAIALNSSMFNTARTLGPAVAGIVVATVGEATAFLLNGLSYTAVIASLLLIRLPPFEPPPRTRQGQQLREGLSYAAREPVVRMLLLAVGSMMLFGFAYFEMVRVFV
jgi:MFS family permease